MKKKLILMELWPFKLSYFGQLSCWNPSIDFSRSFLNFILMLGAYCSFDIREIDFDRITSFLINFLHYRIEGL